MKSNLHLQRILQKFRLWVKRGLPFEESFKRTFLGKCLYAELHKLSSSYHRLNVICFHFQVAKAENDIIEMRRHYSNIVIFQLTYICQQANLSGILCL